MLKTYIIAAIFCMAGVVAPYVLYFSGSGFSGDPATWGQFSDYVGGLLNPFLSSISIIFLIKSLVLQTQANQDLRNELKNSEKTEKEKSFSALFFNMIDSQKTLLKNFSIPFYANNIATIKRGAGAIMGIEDEIEQMREGGAKEGEVRKYLEELDSTDQVFGILRAFSITVKMVAEKLSDLNGFSSAERRGYLLTLVNFTDFAQLRLVIVGIQFMTYPACDYLKNNEELCSVLAEVGLSLEIY